MDREFNLNQYLMTENTMSDIAWNIAFIKNMTYHGEVLSDKFVSVGYDNLVVKSNASEEEIDNLYKDMSSYAELFADTYSPLKHDIDIAALAAMPEKIKALRQVSDI